MRTGPTDIATRSLLAGAFAPPLADEAFVRRVMARIAREAEKIQARLAAFQWAALATLVLLVAANANALAAQVSLALARSADTFAAAAPAAPLAMIAAVAGAAWLVTERA